MTSGTCLVFIVISGIIGLCHGPYVSLKCQGTVCILTQTGTRVEGRGLGEGLTSRHLAPALLEMYTFVLLAKFFPTEPKTQEK